MTTNLGASPLVRQATKTVAFDGTAGNGATGTVACFTVTGQVYIHFIAPHCTEDLVGATSTMEFGVTNAVALFVASTDITLIDAGEWWIDTTPDANGVNSIPDAVTDILLADNDDIILTITTAAVTDGTLAIYLSYTPLSAGASIVAA